MVWFVFSFVLFSGSPDTILDGFQGVGVWFVLRFVFVLGFLDTLLDGIGGVVV